MIVSHKIHAHSFFLDDVAQNIIFIEQEVATVLMVAGAQMKQLDSAAGLKEQLNRFVNQEKVRDGVWKACMGSMNE